MQTLVRTNSRWLLVLAAAIAVIGASVVIGSKVQAFHPVGTPNGPVVCDSTTGNCYQWVVTHLNWASARAAAEAMEHNGVEGHLVTLTSPEENAFVGANLADAVNDIAWIGAYQPAGSVEPAGGWQWVTGEDWVFTNWCACTGEPNNNGGNEDAAHFWGGAPLARWNDIPSGDNRWGFVVEFDDAETPPLPETKAECKKGRWQDFDIFKNQGDCVSFVATGGKNRPAFE